MQYRREGGKEGTDEAVGILDQVMDGWMDDGWMETGREGINPLNTGYVRITSH